MLIKYYDQQGKELGQTRLPVEIFGVKINQDLVHQVVVSQMANRRQISAHTKGRGEVSGGGRKPWRQKGTGRARHGSIRSPLWKGGGVTFGPTKERVFKQKINKKMRRKALLMVLSAKAKNNLLIILDEFKLEAAKTKILAKLIENWKFLPVGKAGKIENFKESTCLIVLPAMDKNTILSARNLAGIGIAQAKDLNVLDLLNFKYLLMPKESIKVVQETFTR